MDTGLVAKVRDGRYCEMTAVAQATAVFLLQRFVTATVASNDLKWKN